MRFPWADNSLSRRREEKRSCADGVACFVCCCCGRALAVSGNVRDE